MGEKEREKIEKERNGRKTEKKEKREKKREKREKERKRKKGRCPQEVLKMSLAEMLDTIDMLAEMLKISKSWWWISCRTLSL